MADCRRVLLAWRAAFLLGAAWVLQACDDPGSQGRQQGALDITPAALPGPEQQMAAGEVLYARSCAVCHRHDGTGLDGVFPPLAASDYLAALSRRQLVDIVLNGLSGPITVNGRRYNSAMPPMRQHSDEEVASILTYVLNSWGNPGGRLSAAEVSAVRTGTSDPPED